MRASLFVLPLMCVWSLVAQTPRLDYGTFLGSAGFETITATAMDKEGNIWVAGYTTSSDFPAAGDAYKNSYTAGRDIFVTKIDPRREREEQIVYSTFIGGTGNEEPAAIAIDDDGFVYVCGYTNSGDFPLAGSAFQGAPGGREDAFILKLNPRVGGADGLVYSTYLGGAAADRATAMAVRNGRVYVVGYTNSETFPTAGPAVRTERAGDWDAFAAIIDTVRGSASETLVYGTRLGGSRTDAAMGVALDPAGNMLITGFTSSEDFPIIQRAIPVSYKGATDAFLTRIDPTRPEVTFSTLIGGSDTDAGYAVTIDGMGAVWVAGHAGSNDFPTTSGAPQMGAAGRGDGFVARFFFDRGSEVQALNWSTLLGGEGGDVIYAMDLADNGDVFVAGYTLSDRFPVRGDAPQRASGGVIDAFFARIRGSAPAGEAIVLSTFWGGSGVETFNALKVYGCNVLAAGVAQNTGLVLSPNATQAELKGFSDGYLTRFNVCGQ